MRKAVLIATVAALVVGLGAWWWATRREVWTDEAVPPPPLRRAMDAHRAGDAEGALIAVRSFLREWKAPAWEDRARVLAAAIAAGARRHGSVPEFLPRALPETSVLGPHADRLRAQSLLAEGRLRESLEAARRAAAAIGFPGHEDAILVLADALERSGRSAEALEILDAEDGPLPSLEAARLAARSGDAGGARRRLAELALDPEDGDAASRALDALIAQEPDPTTRFTEDERPRLARAAEALMDAGQPSRALALVRAALPQDADASSRSPEEALVEARALLALGRAQEARRLVARAASGNATTRDGALYLSARLDAARGRSGAYRAGLESTARSPGRSAWKLRALRDLAEIADGRPTASALAAYRRYRLAAGDRADPVALFREGWIAYDSGRFGEASDAFTRVLAIRDAPAGVQAAALYWTARLHEARRRPDAAASRYREILGRFGVHYYAAVAERRLREAPPPPAPDDAPLPAPGDANEGGRWLLAARALGTIGLWDSAAESYGAAVTTAPAATARSIAVEAAVRLLEQGLESDALRFARLAQGDGETSHPSDLPRRLWRLVYPAPPDGLIERAARAAGLDPRLVASVVMEESAFNPLAVSSAGARGLLQLMPATGAEIARRVGLKGFTPDQLFKPEINLRLGASYLKSLTQRSRSLPMALAAYNAGAARADRWALPSDDRDGDAFAERIPIPATRVYVKRILANERMYRIAWPNGLGEHGGPNS